MSDEMCCAHWLASRATWRALSGRPLCDLEIDRPGLVLERARTEVAGTLKQFFIDPSAYRSQLESVLIGCEAVKHSHPTDDWRDVLARVDRAPVPAEPIFRARLFVSNRFHLIARLASELLADKRLSTVRVRWLLNIRREKEAA
jgi:hypothetical protein